MTEHDIILAGTLMAISLVSYILLALWLMRRPSPFHLSTGPDLSVLPHPTGRQQRWNKLTPREKEVCRLAARGLVNDEIARELRCKPRTVETHLRNSYGKLGIKRRELLPFYLESVVDAPPDPP